MIALHSAVNIAQTLQNTRVAGTVPSIYTRYELRFRDTITAKVTATFLLRESSDLSIILTSSLTLLNILSCEKDLFDELLRALHMCKTHAFDII